METNKTRSHLLLALFLIAGCSGACGKAEESSPPVKNKQVVEPAPDKCGPADEPQLEVKAETGGDVARADLVSLAFDEEEAGVVPGSLELKETAGRGTPAVWKVVADKSAPSKPGAFGTVKTKNRGRTYNVALVSRSSLKDVEISLRVRSVKGKEDQGGGPVWRAKDADNYYIARWNPLEDNFRIYYVKGGERDQIASMNIKLDPSKWHDMKIIMKGKHIEGWLDGEKRLEVDDDTFTEAGMVGLWTKADAETLFDDLVACPAGTKRAGTNSKEVVVYTSVDQVFSEPVLKAFEKKSGLEVKMVFDTEETKSTGLLNRLLAESANPRADVFWSGDPVRPQVLARRQVTVPYRPSTAEEIPREFVASDGSWVGFSARARVLLVNNNLVQKGEEPKRVEDLADPRWKGRAVMANPAFGTTTMHMAALFALWGSEKAAGFLKALKDNDVRVASSNGEVKRLVISGEAAIGLTDTDDAAVAVRSGAPVRVVYPDKKGVGTLLMPTVAVLVNRAPNPENGKRLIDYLASPEVERLLAFADCAQIPLRADVPRPPHVGSAEAVRAMKIDYQWVGVVMEQVHPYLRSWAEGRSGMKVPTIQTAGQR